MQTERERQCARRGLPVFRALLRRTDGADAERGVKRGECAGSALATALVNTLHPSLRRDEAEGLA